jgi:hypothetical protein
MNRILYEIDMDVMKFSITKKRKLSKPSDKKTKSNEGRPKYLESESILKLFK